MQRSSDDRVVLVTGGGRGIGRVIAKHFVAMGATVVALDLRHEHDPTAPVSAVGALTERVCDITDSGAVQREMEWIDDAYGRLDVVVNNAGIVSSGPVDQLTDTEWDRCFEVNVGGTFRVTRAAIPLMKRQAGGRIINAASFAAIIPSIGSAAYAASKSAVVQFTRVLAGELGPWNITANAYAPGMVPSAMNGFAEMSESEQSSLLDTLSLRRWGTAEEVAEVVAFLASDAARYITGALIDVSGGKLATQRPSKAYESSSED